jgi:hypothetical protein
MNSEFLKAGKVKEIDFAGHFSNVILSDNITDITKHIDLTIDNKITVDVKGLKKIKRSDTHPTEFYHWVEIKNVKGEHGWVYGEADYFAFETHKYWVIVSRKDLQLFIEQNVKKVWVTSQDKALYCLYKRQGRKDVISLISTMDLFAISTEVVIKRNGVTQHTIGDSIYEDVSTKQRIERIFNKK